MGNRLKIDYLITDKPTGARLAKGYSIQVAVNMAKDMCFIPAVLLEKIGRKSS
jgi:acyl-CoA thioester hydrolase